MRSASTESKLQKEQKQNSNQKVFFAIETFTSCNCFYVKVFDLSLLLFFRYEKEERKRERKKLIKNRLKLFIYFRNFLYLQRCANVEVNSARSQKTEKARFEIWRFETSKFRETAEDKKPQQNPFF